MANLIQTFQEWMSLAQDNMLAGGENQLLHDHLATCTECQMQWQTMTLISRMFRAAPMAVPVTGFVARFQARLAYREEQRRRMWVALLLGTGVIALTILALPTMAYLLGLTGQLILPYWLLNYIGSAWTWMYSVLSSLSNAIWLLVRSWALTSQGTACATWSMVIAAALMLCMPWIMRQMLSRSHKAGRSK